MKIRAACVQISAGEDWQGNLERSLELARKALRKSPDIVAFPENFLWRGPSEALGEITARTPEAVAAFRDLARRSKTAFLLGSVAEKSPHRGKYYNTSVFISSAGRTTARYRKIHLFDVALKNISVRESRNTAAGRRPVSAVLRGVKLGLSICYDLRFPELYRHLAASGCRIAFVPANFTFSTGQAHWDVLLRARAIENQMFIVAPGQSGTHPTNGIRSFGSTRIISPWGEILASAGVEGEGVITADLDLQGQDRLRREFPVLRHRRL
jgi:deaminated glutathione amidase